VMVHEMMYHPIRMREIGERHTLWSHRPVIYHHLLLNPVGETLRDRCKRRRCRYCSKMTQHQYACGPWVKRHLCIFICSPAQNPEYFFKHQAGILPPNKRSLAVAQQLVARETAKET
jgi:hypothetical protein